MTEVRVISRPEVSPAADGRIPECWLIRHEIGRFTGVCIKTYETFADAMVAHYCDYHSGDGGVLFAHNFEGNLPEVGDEIGVRFDESGSVAKFHVSRKSRTRGRRA